VYLETCVLQGSLDAIHWRLCDSLHPTATHCNSLQLITGAGRARSLQGGLSAINLKFTATHCNSLQLTATHCNSLQLITGASGTLSLQGGLGALNLKFTATHCNSLQLTATHCNSL